MFIPESLQRREYESDIKYKVRLCVAKLNKEVDLDWIEINQILGISHSSDHTRKLAYGYKEIYDDNPNLFEKEIIEDEKGNMAYKETVEIGKGGVQKSDKLVKMSAEDSKDPEFLLKAHGYDPVKWEVTNAKSSIWNQHNRIDGTLTLYASKITVKPLVQGFDFERLEEIVTKKPVYKIETKRESNQYGEYLLIPLFDTHFGISNFEYYKDVFDKLNNMLDNKYKEVLFIIGQDLYHNDSLFNGRTAKGTEIDKVDMIQAWKDSVKFFVPLIYKALDKGSDVKLMYSKGNHSETVEWCFIQYLKGIFPECDVDDTLRERKVHMFGTNLISTTHGDKKNEKRLPENIATEFPVEWSKATTRTLFVGHKHHEMVLDAGGILVRRMPTKNKLDSYHEDRGFTTAHSRFQVHEFNETEQTGLFYL